MKLYYPKSHYIKKYRGELFPLLKPFLKGEGFTNQDRMALYGVSDTDFEIVATLDDAEVCVLPMSWNYYSKTNQLGLAQECILEAKKCAKIAWSFISGDHGVKFPEFDGVIVFRLSGYQSRKQLGHQGMPVFIGDYLSKQNLLNRFLPDTNEQRPVVGFCGQAHLSKAQAGIDLLKKSWFNLKSVLGLSAYETETIIPTTYLRARLLKRLQKSEAIRDHFVLRKQYRAGVSNQQARYQTTQEFYKNILESQYVLCVRGGGNFSVRFYETLMMGRIPVYVHTDGYLPLQNTINWKNHVVWIAPDEQHQIAEKVLSFHNKLGPEGVWALCKRNRELWERYLTLKGFFKTVATEPQ
ncbi:glycosyltransferase family 47 protein [Flavobacteriaceae bacterium GSB9]|nr:glycosyltransferase family 47 protein [Flavobacteriaceae bacterium GSB9]